MKNKIIKPNPYGALIIDELLAFENKLGVVLPQEYRDYLIKYNGAEFENDIFLINEEEGETRMHHIGGLIQEPSYASLLDYYNIFNKDLKNKYLVIADDAFGNQILLKLKEPNFGAIYFWDHEVPFKKIETILIKIANDFYGFIESMTKAEYQNETPKEKLERYKRDLPEYYPLLLKAMKERGEI